jgi:uncharacterized protein YcsI (UPF0317 family)
MIASDATPEQIRAACRSGALQGATSGLALGYVQTNLVILPRAEAFDFLLFCQRNPKPCPLIEVLDAGAIEPRCAPGADLRHDLPGYRVYESGELVAEPGDVAPLWRDDLVSFLIGCSFSFEAALMRAGIRLRHVDEARNVAMYLTNRDCIPAGRFAGRLVVSMRPIKAHQVALAVEVSARYPDVHGAPVHIGAPEALGIDDLARPDFGEAVAILPDEVPVFWACGVTPQAVMRASRAPFCITHIPGRMFVTDRPEPAV